MVHVPRIRVKMARNVGLQVTAPHIIVSVREDTKGRRVKVRDSEGYLRTSNTNACILKAHSRSTLKEWRFNLHELLLSATAVFE
jgi:hypothetical protein